MFKLRFYGGGGGRSLSSWNMYGAAPPPSPSVWNFQAKAIVHGYLVTFLGGGGLSKYDGVTCYLVTVLFLV